MGVFIGIIGYVIAKFFIYRFVAQEINRRLNVNVNPLNFAITRIIIGFLIGGSGLLIIGSFTHRSIFIFYGLFAIIRLFEWFIAITYFYDRESKFIARTVKFSAIGTLISFSVDILGVIFGTITGGGFC